MNLRPYQLEAVAAVEEAAAAYRRVLVASPTGSGKTITFSELLRRRGGKALILCHRDELITQAMQKLQMVWPGVSVGVVKAEQDERGKQVTVASVQTVARVGRKLFPDYATVIVDEAHHASSEQWTGVLRDVGAFSPEGPLTVGFTATPERNDRRTLGQVFEKIVFSRSILQMISAGWLCDLRAKQVSIGVDLAAVKQRAGDYQDGALGDAMHAAGAPALVAEAWLKFGEGRRTLAYLPTVETAKELAVELGSREVKAAVVWGDQPLEERRQVLQRYAEGKIEVLANCAVLLEGYDDPGTSCIIMARPTKSRVLYQQAIGRGLRTFPGKADCLVLDCVGVSKELDLVTVASLFGITEASAEAGISETLRRASAAAASGKPTGDLVAEDAPVFDRGKLHWIQDGRRFLLPGGDCTLVLEQDGLTWSIWRIPRDRYAAKTKLYAELDLSYASGVAEDHVRGLGSMVLARANADWRKKEPSVGQLSLLRKWGLLRPGMTAGEASDLITVRMAARR